MKQMEVTKKEIGGKMFYIRPFPAFTAANISGELASTLSPVIGGLAVLLDDDNKEKELSEIAPTIMSAISGVSGDKIQHLMERLLITYGNVSVSCEETGNAITPLDEDLVNEIFCAEFQNMVMLCVEVVRLNFGGFFKKTADQYGGLLGTMGQKMTSTDGASST